MERVPTEAECWQRFWKIIARGHVNACRREAAKTARGTTLPREQIMQPLTPTEE